MVCPSTGQLEKHRSFLSSLPSFSCTLDFNLAARNSRPAPKPRSTVWSCSEDRVPSCRMRRTVGSVTIPCASNAPGRRKRSGTDTSYRVPRRLVVCGTTVTSARSSSALGAPSTKQGRIFAAKPRSTSQTSPRREPFTELRADRTAGTRGRQRGAFLHPMTQGMAHPSAVGEAAPKPGASRLRIGPRRNLSVAAQPWS